MTEYRINRMGPDGRFESSRSFVCDTDENAIVWAKEMAGEQPAELWIGTRLVQHLGPATGEAVDSSGASCAHVSTESLEHDTKFAQNRDMSISLPRS